jgi:hypothetical protein
MAIARSNPEIRLLVSRVVSGLLFVLLFSQAYMMSRICAWYSPGDWHSLVFLGIIILLAITWIIHTMRCLSCVCLSRLWVLPIIVPFVVFVFSLYKHWLSAAWAAFAVALIVQLLIVLMPRSASLELNSTEGSDGPHS